jgi:uncharacterized membrane protein
VGDALRRLFVLALLPWCARAAWAQATLLPVDGPGGVVGGFRLVSCTPDGRWAVGFSGIGAPLRVLRWSADTGAQALDVGVSIAGVYGLAISDDGRRVAMALRTSSANVGLVWTEGEGVRTLTPARGAWAGSLLLSADGRRVVSTLQQGAVRGAGLWDEDGMVRALPLLDGTTEELALALSASGETVAGSSVVQNRTRAYRWTSANGHEWLGADVGLEYGQVMGLSADGAWAVGCGTPALGGVRALLWGPDGLSRVLTHEDSLYDMVAHAVSADGRVVAGQDRWASSSLDTTFVWTPEAGASPLAAYAQRRGADVSGWRLGRVIHMSPDGRQMAGAGWYNGRERSWMLTGLTHPDPRARRVRMADDALATPGAIVTGLSADGGAVLGRAYYVDLQGVPTQRAGLVWDRAGVRRQIEMEPSMSTIGLVAASDDASVLAATVYGHPQRAAVWRAETGVRSLRVANGATYGTAALAMSADGRVVAGKAGTTGGLMWIDDELPLSVCTLAADGVPLVVSADGRVVAGGHLSMQVERPFVWTLEAGRQLLVLPPGASGGRAQAISGDGTFVAGTVVDAQSVVRAVRWKSGEPEWLDRTPGWAWSAVTGMTRDGRVVVGNARLNGGSLQGVLWTRALGTTTVQRVLALQGYDVLDWLLQQVDFISADGRTLVVQAQTGWQLSIGFSGQAVLRDFVVPCGWSDVAGAGQVERSDGALSADDLVVFVGWFFAGDARADVGGAGGAVEPDGVLTADDLTLFVARFFAGC